MDFPPKPGPVEMVVSASAIVTGGAGGIGAAICRALAQDGHNVVVGDLSLDDAKRIAAEIGGIGVVLNVCDPTSVERTIAAAVKAFGPPKIVVNVAGWDEAMPFLKTTEEFSAKVIDINYAGPVRVLRATLPYMVENGGGRVVNVASDAGRVGSSLEAVYSGAKGGLIAFTKAIAREFAKFQITANNVCPGPTDTPLLRSLEAASENGVNLIKGLTRAIPLGRLGLPEDVAPVVAFLCSESARFITGQTISASGGLTMA